LSLYPSSVAYFHIGSRQGSVIGCVMKGPVIGQLMMKISI